MRRFAQAAICALGPLSERRAAAQVEVDYEVVPDSETTARAVGVQSFPAHMVTDRSGKIVWLSGSDDDRVERLRAMVYRVLASEHEPVR